MAHAHRTARYIQLLRADPRRAAPEPRRTTVAEIQTWKKRIRAFDEAKLRLKLTSPSELQRQNSALRVAPGALRRASFAKYA